MSDKNNFLDNIGSIMSDIDNFAQEFCENIEVLEYKIFSKQEHYIMFDSSRKLQEQKSIVKNFVINNKDWCLTAFKHKPTGLIYRVGEKFLKDGIIQRILSFNFCHGESCYGDYGVEMYLKYVKEDAVKNKEGLNYKYHFTNSGITSLSPDGVKKDWMHTAGNYTLFKDWFYCGEFLPFKSEDEITDNIKNYYWRKFGAFSNVEKEDFSKFHQVTDVGVAKWQEDFPVVVFDGNMKHRDNSPHADIEYNLVSNRMTLKVVYRPSSFVSQQEKNKMSISELYKWESQLVFDDVIKNTKHLHEIFSAVGILKRTKDWKKYER